MAKWTDTDFQALNRAVTYTQFVAMGGTKSYDAWETKRRRFTDVDVENDGDKQAQAALVASFQGTEKANVIKGTLADTVSPELGRAFVSPAFVGPTIAFFDIETTNLKGNFGRIVCASVADSFANVVTFRCDDPALAGSKRRDDSKLAVALRDYLETFDIISGWYSKMFDVPFLNTRLLIAGERPLKSMIHCDPMWKAGQGSLTLHSRRLDAVAKTFRLPTQKTVLDPEKWNDAQEGDKEAIDYVVEHCEKDCLVLRDAYHILKPLITQYTR